LASMALHDTEAVLKQGRLPYCRNTWPPWRCMMYNQAHSLVPYLTTVALHDVQPSAVPDHRGAAWCTTKRTP
jgi:hypothetical protein